MRTLMLILSLGAVGTGSNQSIRTITLNSRNTVSLSTAINWETTADVQIKLIKADHTARFYEPVYLTLNSPGGSIGDGEKIIETVNGMTHRVDTISIFSASMSFILSQYLGKRYILESGTMMSHRAYAEGLSGQVPGNLITRTLGLLTNIIQLDKHIAARSGMKLEDYQALVQDELWMRGQEAVNKNFADSLVRVTCDSSLQGTTEPKVMRVFLFNIKVTWYKCPLITEPASIEMADSIPEATRKEILTMFYNPGNYLRQYGLTQLSGGRHE